MKKNISVLKFEGSNYFRLKIAYSLLLNKEIEITDIRSSSVNPGLTKYEISFLNLVSKITNGTKITINKTGTGLSFVPGTITNNYGDEFTFDCDKSRCISYYAEGLIPISLFGKESLHIVLQGITNNSIDNSVDSFKSSTCVLLQKLVVGDTVQFDILGRGVEPNGVGKCRFKCPIITNIAPFDWVEVGRVKRVRGIAFTSKIPQSFANRIVNKVRGVLNNFLPDVWIGIDSHKDKNLENISPGYGVTLTAETKNGFAFSSDAVNQKDIETPEDLGKKLSIRFLNDIYNAGAVNGNNLGLFLFLMALSEKNYVSQMKVGKITGHTKGVIILIDKLLGVKFNIKEVDDYDKEEEEEENNEEENEEEEEEKEENEDDEDKEDEVQQQEESEAPVGYNQFIFSCVGIGLRNVARIELS